MNKCSWLFAALIAAIVNWSTCSATEVPSASHNVTGISGGSLLLNCTVGFHQGTVSWLRPSDNAAMSNDYSLLDVESERGHRRLMVIGNASRGEFHLLIRYTLFPQDAGTWLCSAGAVTHKVHVLLLVRPSLEKPAISPSGDSLATADIHSSDNDEFKTFTCTAHFAFPPVQLTWIKETGPEVPHRVTLPSMVVSRAGLVSSSIKLILSKSNSHSLFSCHASHPTFFGKVFSSSLRFHLSEGGGGPQALVQEPGRSKTLSATTLARFDALDRVFLLLIIAMVLLGFTVGILMNKYHSRWQFDVPLDRIDQNLNTKPLCEVVTGEEIKRKASPKSRRRFTCKVVFGLIMILVLISSLIFAFPVYYKGVTIPTVDADELASVMAGSALWLDCRLLVQPPMSVLQVAWLHNGEPFYYQHYMNGQNIGFPHNSTKGFMMGMRVSSQGLGQITIWPVAPGEDGHYTCQALLFIGDNGMTEERRKTTMVFVSMGPIVNYVLIALLALALLSSSNLFILFIYHTLRIRRKGEEEKSEDEDV